MREINMIESRAVQIGLLEEVDKYCEKNNLTYYMSYGTLLGAVRHKGFIPWDDDIDIAMPYPDYSKFCSNYKGEFFKVNHWKSNPDFYCNFAKFEDTRTISFEDVSQNYTIGINIDIAPIIGLPDNLKKAQHYFNRIMFYRRLLTLKKIRFKKERTLVKQIVLLLSKAPLMLLPNRLINRIIDNKCKKYPYETSKYIICVGSFNPVKEIMEKKKLGKTVKLVFENRAFSAPDGYDAWLTYMFGDYMQLPPEEKRVSHHTFKAYWR